MRSCGATAQRRRSIAKYQVSGKSNPAGMESHKLEMIERPSYIAFIRGEDARHRQLGAVRGTTRETRRNETMTRCKMMTKDVTFTG